MMKPKFRLMRYILFSTSVFIFALSLILVLGRMDESIEAAGEVFPQNHYFVYSTVEGFIDSIYVKEGEFVKKSQLLASIRENRLSSSKILSPHNGLILSSNLYELRGKKVKKGEVLMVMTDPQKMGFRAKLPEKRAPFIKTGLSANIFIDAFPHQKFGTFKGVVSSISSASEPEQGKVFYPATIIIEKPYVESELMDENQRLFLKPGMKGKAKIIIRSDISFLKKLTKKFLS
ncbi:MAG: HlyD family efflux transporter periplasmic adaptor subunit [Candidatus Zixiibacteriota bacterium]